MKNLVNTVVDLYNLLTEGLVYSSRMSCYGMTIGLGGSQEELDKTREGCAHFFQLHEVSRSHLAASLPPATCIS